MDRGNVCVCVLCFEWVGEAWRKKRRWVGDCLHARVCVCVVLDCTDMGVCRTL